MPTSEKGELRELQVYKMLERLGLELGAGVIPRYGLMDISAVRNRRSCEAASPGTEYAGAASSPAVVRDFCPKHDVLLAVAYAQTVRRNTAKH